MKIIAQKIEDAIQSQKAKATKKFEDACLENIVDF